MANFDATGLLLVILDGYFYNERMYFSYVTNYRYPFSGFTTNLSLRAKLHCDEELVAKIRVYLMAGCREKIQNAEQLWLSWLVASFPDDRLTSMGYVVFLVV